MENTQYFKVLEKGFAAFYFERMSVHPEVVRAVWQRRMTQTLLTVMRYLEEQLLSHITELQTHCG